MESKVEKISTKEIKVSAFNIIFWVRGLVSIAFFSCLLIIPLCNNGCLSYESIMLIFIMSYILYIIFLRDMFVSHTKYIKMEKEVIYLNNKKIFKKDLDYVAVVVSSMNSVSVITSYRVDILLRRGFFRRIPLISFTSDKEELAVQTGREIADFLGIEFKDLTHSWE